MAAMRAVLFDFDGVLVNSEPLHYRALRGCLLPEGIDISEEEYCAYYLAYDDWRAMRLALERHGAPSDADRVEALVARKTGLFDELLATVPFFPGARELVQGLAREVPVGIASGAQRQEIERILEAAGLRPASPPSWARATWSAANPTPIPICTAMARLRAQAPGLEPAQCVVIEDTMAGIASGLAAGMKVVGVAQTYAAAKLQSAHLVVATVADLDLARLRELFA